MVENSFEDNSKTVEDSFEERRERVMIELFFFNDKKYISIYSHKHQRSTCVQKLQDLEIQYINILDLTWNFNS